MGIFDFLKSSDGSKIKVQRYYNEENKELNLPEIKASINAIDKKGELSLKIGSEKTVSKLNIPNGISKELVELDQLQIQLANAINGLRGKSRQEQLVKYTDTLMKMIELISSTGSDFKKKVVEESTKKNVTSYSDLKRYLDERKFRSTLLPDSLDKDQGFIIWPVTLLSKTTFIHKAQAQLIKLLVDSGWKLHIIIGDCGKNTEWKAGFTDNINGILDSLHIKVQDDTIAFLGEYYRQNDSKLKSNLIENVDGGSILSYFHKISEGLIWDDFDKLIKKNYDNEKKSEIDKRKVLNNIQPLLIWSLVTAIVRTTRTKSILIAGEDEQDQWKYITDNFTSNDLSVIYIHELKKEDDKTMDQVDLKMDNIHEMRNKLAKGNMAQWLFTHFVELPKFTSGQKPSFCKISDSICEKFDSNCIRCLFEEGNSYKKQQFDKKKFVDHIWPLANPANN